MPLSSVCPVSICATAFQWGTEWCHTRRAPSVSGCQRGRDGSLGCTWGKWRQTEYRTECYQLSLPYADGIRHGWVGLTVSKVHEGLRFTLVWISVSGCVCVQGCTCARTVEGELGPTSDWLFSWTSHHFRILKYLFFFFLFFLANKAEQTNWK